MTAEETFNELGFTKSRESKYSLTYILKNVVTTDMITFYKNDKSFIAVEYSEFGDEYGRPMDIGIDLYKAISKEMEELGWVNS